MKSNLSRKELQAIQKTVGLALSLIDKKSDGLKVIAPKSGRSIARAAKRIRHNLHELEESFPGLKPLGGGGSDK